MALWWAVVRPIERPRMSARRVRKRSERIRRNIRRETPKKRL